MPHKKGKRKTIPKHKKKGVKLIRNHKISADYPNKTNVTVGAHGTQKNIPRIAIKGKGVRIPTVQKKQQQQQQTLQKRRLPVEVMPGNDSGSEWNRDTVRVIDNISDSPKKREPYGNGADASNKPDIKVINLTQAKKIREQVWIHHNGKNFETKCYVSWCTNMVDVFNFQVGHDTPKALGGSNTLLNLKPICQNCNQSMGSRYSIAEWNQLFTAQRRQMSTLISRDNYSIDIIKPIEYEKIDLSANIFVKQHPINILADQEVPIYPIIQQTEKMQPGNAQHTIMKSGSMCYGPLARFMPVRANRSVIIQSALGVIVLVGAWFFGA